MSTQYKHEKQKVKGEVPKEREIQRSTWFCSQMMYTNEGAEARTYGA